MSEERTDRLGRPCALSADDVRAIRAVPRQHRWEFRRGARKALARRFNVSVSVIQDVRRRRSYRWVDTAPKRAP